MALYWQNDDPSRLEALRTRSQAEFLAAFDIIEWLLTTAGAFLLPIICGRLRQTQFRR
jgi:hypothetical protein